MRANNPTVDVLLPFANAFQTTLIRLEADPIMPLDSFSAACLEVFEFRNPEGLDYRIAQVFEPAVLEEVAFLEGVAPDAVASLAYAPSQALRDLLREVEDSGGRSGARSLNLALVLISISRFSLAERVLADAPGTLTSDEERFLHALLCFIVDNRNASGKRSADYFSVMRAVAESGMVPATLLLDGCTQAVVWYLKRREVNDEDLRWFVHRGLSLVHESRASLSPGAISSWYRGIAMLPARVGNAEKTRSFMESARRAADETLSVSTRAYDIHLRKTYYESTMKEYMYVRPDLEMAEQAGRDLIALDPLWGPSWAELAEAYVHFGHRRQAASAYDSAVRLGAPWVRHALQSAGDLYRELGEDELALSRYYALTLFPTVELASLDVAVALAASVRPDLADELADVRAQQQLMGAVS